ncbi:MAG: NADH-quinone oxidoreductase subunit C [Candidatus Sulfotelmatobacter sp.]
MPDEPKSSSPPPPGGEPKPTADQAVIQGGVKATASGSVQPESKIPPDKPAVSVPSPVAPKPAAPAKPPAPAPTPWNSPMTAKFTRTYGSGLEPLTYAGQNYMVVDRSLIPDILQVLRNEEQFDFCVDITAVHYPQREKQFDVVWVLYSFARNERIRVKTQIRDGESLPSSVPIWTGANWLEREVFDMFGIRFEGHPDLKRILLPDGWKGHPLRKDYGILQQDNEWVQINLGIESGQ